MRNVVPDGVFNFGLEHCGAVEIELCGEELAVRKDFWRLRVFFGRHIAGFFEHRQVGIRLHVTRGARVAVPVPGATKVAGLVDDADAVDAFFAQIRGREHSSKAASHDHHFNVLCDRVAGEAGFGIRVGVDVFEHRIELEILVHAVLPQAFFALDAVTVSQFFLRKLNCVCVLLGHSNRAPWSFQRD